MMKRMSVFHKEKEEIYGKGSDTKVSGSILAVKIENQFKENFTI